MSGLRARVYLQQPTETSMRRAIVGAIGLLVLSSAAFACGTERWPVKTGTDRDARRVANLPKPTTIAQLVSIVAPAHPERRRTSRFAPTELAAFQIAGILKVIKRELDDDYHLVIADPANPRVTMIVEAPDPRCALGRQFLDNISFVRQVLDQRFGEIIRLEPNVPVTVTGVAFFDRLHHQEGVPPNGIELHPILVIAFQ
jgi:hypothetical protein